jgi:hypothetical protein
MDKGILQWLAESIGRHIAIWASRRHRKTGESPPFDGLNEANTALIVDRILTGMGFFTSGQYAGYTEARQRSDLFAETPNGKYRLLIEIKNIADFYDARLNEKRFFEQGEHLGDFRRLKDTTGYDLKIVVWTGWSDIEELIAAGEGAKTMRIKDALLAVKKEFPAAECQEAHISLEEYSECKTWKFCHIYCWSVK